MAHTIHIYYVARFINMRGYYTAFVLDDNKKLHHVLHISLRRNSKSEKHEQRKRGGGGES